MSARFDFTLSFQITKERKMKHSQHHDPIHDQVKTTLVEIKTKDVSATKNELLNEKRVEGRCRSFVISFFNLFGGSVP